jgi:hypothetical protein
MPPSLSEADRERLLADFIGMYGSSVHEAIEAYRAGADPRPLLFADLPDDRVVPDMDVRALGLAEVHAALDPGRVTSQLLRAQVQRLVQDGQAHRRCVVGVRFADGEVLGQVLQVRRRRGP